MTMISNQAVTVQELAMQSFDNGIQFSSAFAEFAGTIFEPVWLDAWSKKESEYEVEYNKWLDACDDNTWNEAADIACYANEIEA